MIRLSIILIICLFTMRNASACSAFCLQSDHHAVLAKNLDWPVDDGLILMNCPGITKSAFGTSAKRLTWVSRYYSITFNQFGKEFPLGGMNEAGLVVEELNMPAYDAVVDSCRYGLNEFQLVQYLLDNCATLEEVSGYLEKILVTPALVSLHYLVMERSGGSLILEPDQNGITVISTDLTPPVLSNNPYMESLKYLSKFRGFGGDLPVVHREGSNERFVSMAGMLNRSFDGNPVSTAFAMLDTVSQMDTRWSIVYDVSNLTVSLKFHNCRHVRTFHLEELMDQVQSTDTSPVSGQSPGTEVSDCREDSKNTFRLISSCENAALIRTVFDLLHEDLNLAGRPDLVENWIIYSQRYMDLGKTKKSE